MQTFFAYFLDQRQKNPKLPSESVGLHGVVCYIPVERVPSLPNHVEQHLSAVLTQCLITLSESPGMSAGAWDSLDFLDSGL